MSSQYIFEASINNRLIKLPSRAVDPRHFGELVRRTLPGNSSYEILAQRMCDDNEFAMSRITHHHASSAL